MKTYRDALFEEVSSESYFYLNDGNTIKSLADLLKYLRLMDDSLYFHHVTSDRNDFSNWIHDVVRDQTLAQAFLKAKDRDAMITALEDRYVKIDRPAKVKMFVEEKMESQAKKQDKQEEEKKEPDTKEPEKLSKEEIAITEPEKKEPEKTEPEKVPDEEPPLEEKPVEKDPDISSAIKKIEKDKKTLGKMKEGLEKVPTDFFTKDFVQGLIIGGLFVLLLMLFLIKFRLICG